LLLGMAGALAACHRRARAGQFTLARRPQRHDLPSKCAVLPVAREPVQAVLFHRPLLPQLSQSLLERA
jgi:hypothetical protein